MNKPKRPSTAKDIAYQRPIHTLDKISCQSESELSEGSKHILKHQQGSLFSFLRWKLTHHHLHGKYSEFEVFSEAYQRATQTLRKGQKIDNLYGWYKGTGYNIIREYSRKEKKQKDLKTKLEGEAKSSSKKHGKVTLNLDEESPILKTIKHSLRNEIDVKIIYLRVVYELPWVNVCEVLIQDGDLKGELSKQCIERIRQRFHRALKKLPKLKP